MCGRFALEDDIYEVIEMLFPEGGTPDWGDMPARLNIAPTQPIAMVTNGVSGSREGLLARWGFMPAWVKKPKEFTLIINARSETAAEKPSFRNAMRHRRALVPASGFYEWQRFGKGSKSQAYWVRPRKGGIVLFGALLETWAGKDGSEVDTGCIITTQASSAFSKIHHRLPLVIDPADIDRWLDCKTQEPRDVADLMVPASDELFEAIPIGNAVNKVANCDPSIRERVDPILHGEGENDDDQLSMF